MTEVAAMGAEEGVGFLMRTSDLAIHIGLGFGGVMVREIGVLPLMLITEFGDWWRRRRKAATDGVCWGVGLTKSRIFVDLDPTVIFRMTTPRSRRHGGEMSVSRGEREGLSHQNSQSTPPDCFPHWN